tara:strand:- start:32 stop:658 length:627 start_codon:yes stop_codon:yes gene_type:complete
MENFQNLLNNKYMPWNWKQQKSGFSVPPQGKGQYRDSGGKIFSDDPTKIFAGSKDGTQSIGIGYSDPSIDTKTGPTSIVTLPDGTVTRVPTNQVPEGGVIMPGSSTTGTGTVIGSKEKESMLGSMFGVDYDKYIQGQKDLFKEMSQEGYRVGAMKRLPDLAHSAFGGSYATALQPGMANLAQIASNLRPYQFGSVNIPTRTNFASLLR